MNKTIFRNKKKKNYTVIGNQLINAPGLSWKAKGILIYLLSKPEDWVTRLEDIVKHSADGRASVLSGIKELKQKGYLEKIRITDKNTGLVTHWETIVHEEPITRNPDVENRHSGNPDSGNPQSGKPNTTKYGSNKDTDKESTECIHTQTKERSKDGVCTPSLENASLNRPIEEQSPHGNTQQTNEQSAESPTLQTDGSSKKLNLVADIVAYANTNGWALKATKGLVSACEGKSWGELVCALQAMCEQFESDEGVRHQQRYFTRAVDEGWEASEDWLESKRLHRQEQEDLECSRGRVGKAVRQLIDQGELVDVEWGDESYSYRLPGAAQAYHASCWQLPKGWSWNEAA